MSEEDAEMQFERLYRAHADAVFAYAIARGSADAAKDVVEETFLVAWRRLDDVPDEPRAWLLGVARRVMSHDWRGRDRRAALAVRVRAERAFAQVGADPAVEVVERDLTLAVLDGLPSSDRELLCLLAWGDLAPEEVARLLDCTLPALRVRLHRARRRFEAALAKADPAPSPSGRSDRARADTSFSPIRALVPKELP
jgi:RNA polymerase sigma-70 factor (ECF subfamily)